MSAPVLNREMVLETPVTIPDGAGGHAGGWQALGTLWAELRPRTGRDAVGEGAALSLMRYRIVLRAAPDGSSMRPRAGQRLRLGARRFRIQAVAEFDARARYLECFAQEEEAT
ncbi:head-tail adaptor protein [Sediminimonas sp.]|uniref:head-tail adaptor protein n=1 Tax=Sediminimonas sp. TaxID=2823379 RepID=UPI0025D72FF8|nr:head-tail adaptor protein [Sediminimonas sp.]